MPMILIVLLFAGGTIAVDHRIAADLPSYPIDERCFDDQGVFHEDWGADDLDCGNEDPQYWK